MSNLQMGDDMKFRCPCCGSTSIRSRTAVHKSGTSVYSGKSTNWGLGIGKNSYRGWFGIGKYSGIRQNLLAKEAAPMPFFPPPILIILLLLAGFGQWIIALLIVWFLMAFSNQKKYESEWLCKKCGQIFTPEVSKR